MSSSVEKNRLQELLASQPGKHCRRCNIFFVARTSPRDPGPYWLPRGKVPIPGLCPAGDDCDSRDIDESERGNMALHQWQQEGHAKGGEGLNDTDPLR